MIYDTIPHLLFYLPQEIRQEITFFAQKITPVLPDGKYQIRETDIFAQISTYKTDNSSARIPEVHRKYIDIQILLSGRENIHCCPVEHLLWNDPKTEYNEEKDVQFFEMVPENDGVWLRMFPGNFAVFFPQDAHTPQYPAEGQCSEDDGIVRKVVIKVNRKLWSDDSATSILQGFVPSLDGNTKKS